MRVAVLVSGNGTNLQALIDARASGALAPAELCCVVSNRPDVHALERARRADIAAEVVDHKRFADRATFERELHLALARHRAEAIVLAGFMRILTADFVERYPLAIINTHPALCPAFPGIHAPQQALDYGVRVTGCTVHFVDAGVDTGPIIFQEAVPVTDEDDAESLHDRIRSIEHRLLPRALQLLAARRLAVHGRRVTIADA